MAGRGRSTTSEVTNTTSPRRRPTMAGTRARTSRWVPTHLTPSTPSNAVGVGVQHRAGDVLGGVGHQDLDRAEGVDRAAANRSTESAVGQVEMDGEGLPAAGPDGRRRLLALGHPPGPEDHRVAEGGQGLGRGLADARRGAGHHGRAHASGWRSKRGISGGSPWSGGRPARAR